MLSIIEQIQQDVTYSERTQISLSPTLRKVVEKKRAVTGESLSEYIRGALKIRVKAEESEYKERMSAVKTFVGAGKVKKHKYWNTDKKIENWQRMLRRDNRY